MLFQIQTERGPHRRTMLRSLLLMVAVCSGIAKCNDLAGESTPSDYYYWRNATVGSPELFTIDKDNEVIIVAVKNNLFHISLDLKEVINVRDTTPTFDDIDDCMTKTFQSQESCQNFHHILVFPTTSNNSITVDGESVNVRQTVLVCGSNAFRPKCTYRNRTNLNHIQTYDGQYFCPFGEQSTAKAIITDEGYFMSSSSQDLFTSQYGVSVSHDPFNGTSRVRTIATSQMFKSPSFVDLYEIGPYYYVFMTEPAIEVSDDIIYSRVGRICKNDAGVLKQQQQQNFFSSFLKARMTCTYEGNTNYPTYYYNNLMDTEYVASGTVNTMVMGKHLYATFSSPMNGPDGSILCVYTFDGEDNDLDGIFSQKYLEQMGSNEWVAVSNPDPVSCSEPHRDLGNAEVHYLMDPIVTQVGDPLIKLDGLLFRRIIIDKVEGVNGNTYEVILIAANQEDFVKVLKMTYVYSRSGVDQTHIAQETIIESAETVESMELYKTNITAALYLNTNEGLYKVPITDCNKYTDCRSCVESRDPYCAYDNLTSTCVNTLTGYTVNYIQDIDNGLSTDCPPSPSSTMINPSIVNSNVMIPSSVFTSEMTPAFTTECIETVDVSTTTVVSTITQTISITPGVTSSTNRVVSTPTDRLSTTTSIPPTRSMSTSMFTPISSRDPSASGVEESEDNNHLYMMIGIGAACFLVGIAFGIVTFACLRNKDKFIWGKMLSRNRRLNFSEDHEKCNGQYEMCTKGSEYEKNNAFDFAKGNTPRPSTPPLTKLNPTGSTPGGITDSPILSKYTPTGKLGHARSYSSGGQFPLPTLADIPARHSPVPESPIRKNMRNTFHIEEGVSNSDRQRYGKNVVSKQLSREYPMTNGDANHHHVKTHSFDLNVDGWNSSR